MSEPRGKYRAWWLVAGIALTLFKLWLARSQTVFAIGHAGHDDRLFVQLAQSIARGDWLGAYHNLTLAKGAFYSLWIAAVYWLGVPLLLANQVAYAAACAAFVRAVRPAIASAGALFALYALLLWNPVAIEASSLGRILRQHVNIPQLVLIFAAFAALYYRREQPLRRLAPWAITLGLTLASFWLTREEAIFLLPALVLLSAACFSRVWRERAARSTVVAAFALAALAFALPLLVVSTLNYRHYGWFGTVEFRASEFKDAYGAMVRVKVGPEIPYVPVTHEAREAMYDVSPTFAQLRPFLEGDIGRSWAEASTGLTGHPASDRQIGGGWLMWALRDAVAAAGRAPDARTALQFYRKMADEINAACDAGRLPARSHRSGFTPVLRSGDAGKIAKTFVDFSRFVTGFSAFSVRSGPSEGDDADLELFRDLTRERLSPRAGEMEILGPTTAGLFQRNLDRLETIDAVVRRVLPVLFVIAEVLALLRAGQLLILRTWSFPLTIALAAWITGAAGIAIHAVIHVTSFPVLVISSFASVYPLLTIFIGAVLWDAIVGLRQLRFRRAPSAKSPAPSIPAPPVPAAPVFAARLVWLAGIAAISPFLIWHRSFSHLVWFGDEFQLVHEISQMGMGAWVWSVFSENFVPLFKALWGGALIGFDGSYRAMLWLLWLTHVLNAVLLGRILLRSGFPWLSVLLTQILFGMIAANIETLAWTVQWSAVLALTFLLLGLLWHDRAAYGGGQWNWAAHGPLVLASAASACSFSRGVITGGVLACALLLPALLSRSGRAFRVRLGPAIACLIPSVAVALIIGFSSQGNHQQMSGHWGAAFEFAARYFLLNPLHLIIGGPSPGPAAAAMLGAVKLTLLAGGILVARGRARTLLWLLLVYDLSNALLIGLGRYHTGPDAALSSRYNYSSLVATLPFATLLLTRGLDLIRPVRVRVTCGATLVAFALFWSLHRWPDVLDEFVGWRGERQRALLAEPFNPDPKASIPGVEYFHVERAKAIQRAYHLH